MYSVRKFPLDGFFGAVVLSSSVLRPRNEYVFTFEHGRIFEYRSDSWVLENLRDRMANYGDVISVNRPLFSSRYLVTVIPTLERSLAEWVSAFDSSWKDMGYGNAVFVMAEEGRVASEPGGVAQIIPEIPKLTGELVKPVLPYALLLGVGYIMIKALPKIITSVKGVDDGF